MHRNCYLGVLCIGVACADTPSQDDDAAADAEAATDTTDATASPTTSTDTTDPSTSSTSSEATESTGTGTGSSEDDDGTTGDGEDSDDGSESDSETGEPQDTSGVMFALGNAEDSNTVVMFSRDVDGLLAPLGEFATGGHGSGGGLGSQGSMALDGEAYLYVVNAGDDTVSSLRIYEDHVALVDIVSSGGIQPTSLALHEDRLYVLNADGAGSVAGFTVDAGMFTPIDGAQRALSGHEAPAPAQIAVTPDGGFAVVTERASDRIVTYAIATDGSLGEPVVNPSEGQTPFGFQFTSDGVFVVSEAFGGGANPGASAASSYRVSDGGLLWTFSASVPDGETAACWIEIVGDRFAYTTNAGSNTVSAYEIDRTGAIALLPNGGVVAELGDEHSPIDMATSADERFLYVANSTADAILGFAIADDGTLTPVGDPTAVPPSAVGLAGF